MERGKHASMEIASNYKKTYEGHHREGVGFIPLGNRSRALFEFGVPVEEERDSVDIATSKRR